MPGMAKRQILFNYPAALQQPFVIVVEGITDVWATGPWAVARLGKSPSHQQCSLLLQNWQDKPIVLMLDGGTQEQAAMQCMVWQLTSPPSQPQPRGRC